MAKRKAPAGAAAPTFEEALARLETIVRELEEADLPLERSLTVFEEGVRLSRLLHERLNEAERKVEILMKNEAGEKVAGAVCGRRRGCRRRRGRSRGRRRGRRGGCRGRCRGR